MLPPNTSLYYLVEDAWGITVLLPTHPPYLPFSQILRNFAPNNHFTTLR